MRVSRAQAAENHQAVINAASNLFREHGFDGIGLKDLMKGAGLTQGGFYKQFASKEDLMAQASGRAIEGAALRWSRAIEARRGDALDAILTFYLTAEHRDDKGEGCPFVALAGDAARQGPKVKAQFQDGLHAHLQMLERVFAQADSPTSNHPPQGAAMAVLSLLVGSVLLSRTVNDPALSQDLLAAAATAARDIAPA
ncbi:TetR/AcrR family transcriptional regulator [Rhodobacteraceae bacterium]|nr:TetR/AcrR family transcriptional regulator [Paracoccaceae bacterium]